MAVETRDNAYIQQGKQKNDGGCTRPQRCGTIGTTVTEKQEYETGGGGETGQQGRKPQRCGTAKMAV